MKDSLRLIGIIVGVIFVGVLLFMNSDTRINWNPTFKSKDKNPFGTYVLFNELSLKEKDYSIEKKKNINTFITNHLDNLVYKDSLERLNEPLYNVILIEKRMQDLNYYDNNNLLEFIEEGHTVLIISEEISEYMLESIDEANSLISTYITDSVFVNTEFNSELIYPNAAHKQHFYNAEYADNIYGYSANSDGEYKPFFIEYKLGKGQLLLHTFPYVFTNYYMLDSNSVYRESVERIINHLPNKKTIWSESSKRFIEDTNDKNILSIITSIPQLNFAWKLLLIGLILYTLFKVKREQRIIPKIKPLQNKSKEFIEVISQVHLLEENFTSLSQKKYIYIIDFLRKTHYIDINIKQEFLLDSIKTKTILSEMETKIFLNYIQKNKTKQHFSELEFLEFCKLSDKIENIK